MVRLSLHDSLAYGWQSLVRQPSRWLVPAFVYGLVTEVLAIPFDALPEAWFLWLLPVTGAYLVLSFFLMLGLTRASLKAYDGAPLRWRDLFDFSHHAGHYLGVSLLLAGIFLMGLVPLVIPGFIALALLGFALWIVAEHGTRPLDAVRQSWAMTRGHRLKVLGFSAILAVPSVFLGMMLEHGGVAFVLALGLQAVLTVVTVNATTHLYRQLQGRMTALSA